MYKCPPWFNFYAWLKVNRKIGQIRVLDLPIVLLLHLENNS